MKIKKDECQNLQNLSIINFAKSFRMILQNLSDVMKIGV